MQTRCRPSGDQAVVGPTWAYSLLGLHLVYTWSTPGPLGLHPPIDPHLSCTSSGNHMHLNLQPPFANSDSESAPSDFKHKHNELNVHFAWRPGWTTAEQAHTGAHTYTSARNALHTCTTYALTHCYVHVAHVCMRNDK